MLKGDGGGGGSTPGCPAVECKRGRGAGGQGVTSDGAREGGEAPEEVPRPLKSGKKLLIAHLSRCFPL